MPGAAVAGRHVRTYPWSGTCYLLRDGGLSLCLDRDEGLWVMGGGRGGAAGGGVKQV